MPAEPSAATVTSRYRLIEQIGQGGMGVVYRAVDRLTRQTVALKRVTAPGERLAFTSRTIKGHSSDVRLALAQEFRTLSSLRHPHIISVLDYGFDADHQPFYTMELLNAARPLDEVLRGQPLAQKLTFVVQVLQALAYLHRRGIIHRDLKPSNVLVSGVMVKVVDFGLALMRDLSQEGKDSDDAIVGTLAYIAPEILRGVPPSQSSDLYAVGVMLYELLAEQHPYRMDNPTLLIEAILTEPPDVSHLDVAEPLARVVERLVTHDLSARFQTADQVINALLDAHGAALAVNVATSTESFLQAARFVGREHELQKLHAALRDAQQGQGSAWLVTGESGVGKSRLLDELRTLALVEGVMVMRGQSVSTGGLPYRQWRDPIRRLALATQLTELQAGVLREVVPDLDEIVGHAIKPVAQLEGDSQQGRLVLTIRELFQAQNQPMLLLLEDLHWASESLKPLMALVEQVAHLPLLIVGAYRDDESPDLPEQLPGAKLIRLQRLRPDEILRLSESMLGQAGRKPDVVSLLQRETEGNAYFIVEVVRALAEDAGSLSKVGEVTLPERVMAGGIEAVVQRRLERVQPGDRELLKLAAVIGRQIDTRIMEALADGEDINSWLGRCSDAAVLEIHEGTWRFAHDQLRETLVKNLLHSVLPNLNRRVALAIEAVYGDDPERSAALTEHWYMAGDGFKAAHHAAIAGEQAILVSDFQQAQELIARGLNLLPEDGAYAEKARLLKQLGTLFWRLSNYDHASRFYTESLELARKADDSQPVAEVLNALAFVESVVGDLEQAEAHAQEALRLAVAIDDPLNAARGYNNMGLVMEGQERFLEARSFYERGLALFREIDDLRGAASALNNLGTTADSQGDYQGARAYYLESLELCEQIGYGHGAATLTNNLGLLYERLDDGEAAWQAYKRSLPLAETVGDRRGSAVSMLNLVFMSVNRGHIRQARHYLRDALVIIKEIDAGRLIPHALAGAAQIKLAEGDAIRAAELVGAITTLPGLDLDFKQVRLAPLQQALRAALADDVRAQAVARGVRDNLDSHVDSVIEDVRATQENRRFSD